VFSVTHCILLTINEGISLRELKFFLFCILFEAMLDQNGNVESADIVLQLTFNLEVVPTW